MGSIWHGLDGRAYRLTSPANTGREHHFSSIIKSLRDGTELHRSGEHPRVEAAGSQRQNNRRSGNRFNQPYPGELRTFEPTGFTGSSMAGVRNFGTANGSYFVASVGIRNCETASRRATTERSSALSHLNSYLGITATYARIIHGWTGH